jgi:hypothetical protein
VRATAETEAKTYAFSIPYKNLPLKAPCPPPSQREGKD